MSYTRYTFPVPNQEMRDILIAGLTDVENLGFEETDTTVSLFVQNPFDEVPILEVAKHFELPFEKEELEEQNWNALWESNFEPVIVPGFCTVKAHFHDIVTDTPYEIRITPKMSFGTGHHATTMMMMLQMRDIDFVDKTVLDFGCGTGILAILAEKLGANKVVGIDNDEWAVNNANENITLNDNQNITIGMGSLGQVSDSFDVILANINRNILLQYMDDFVPLLTSGGKLLLSGILTEDVLVIMEAANRVGFKHLHSMEHNGWNSILLTIR